MGTASSVQNEGNGNNSGDGSGTNSAKSSTSNQSNTGATAPSPNTGYHNFKKYKELKNNANIFDLYKKGGLLGSGNMASVYRYTRIKDNFAGAAKVVEKSTLSKLSEFTNELEILAACAGHKHILDLHDIFEDNANFYLLTDILEGGELFDRICDMGIYNEKIAKDIIRPILGALQHIHSKGVLHRDVKPENLLLMDKSPEALLKVADFGVAAWIPDLEREEFPKCGTPEYLAPEMYGPRGCRYGKPVDVWALGCVLFIMLCGWHPFQVPDNLREQKNRIVKGDLSELDTEDISDDAKDIIRKMLEVDPDKRWDINQLFQHPWLKDPTSETQERPLVNTQKKLKSFLQQRFRKVAFGLAFATSLRSQSGIKPADVKKAKEELFTE